jgi:hypothetical protein
MRHTSGVLRIALDHPHLFASLTYNRKPIMHVNKILSQAERNAVLKVAQYANPRHAGPTKEEAKLNSRRADYNTVLQRKDGGTGFHRPGSVKKG